MRIAVHAFEKITAFHLAAPLLVFGEVSRQGLATGWSTTVWSAHGCPVRTEEGIVIDDLAGAGAADSADLLVFPSWPDDFPEPDERLVGLIRAAHERGAVIAGLCLGAFPVAASGVIDNRAAATHWAAASRLSERYPAVDVRADALYLDHGDVLTSAGTASALDACLHVVRTRLGSAAAAAVARHLVIAPHREGDQAQYIDRPVLGHATGPIGETIEWALAHLDQRLSVDAMAARARMSPRNFSRRFHETTGMSPARWVLTRRLDEARRLLETTTWPVSRIAEVCGFASTVTFRQNFVAHYATTPTSYRYRFTDRGDQEARRLA
ncbi:GlxA family transcriptional regulator [Saccharomonospora cyanea]|uniref:Transcriptional regulator containing an amidase domain and an AraC-type DNA-binding HTH domain n=1 Tax=Saccharomonospora cyanea NA-134 TaxID=882082 RepID=H5XEB7_9PSEU|nr:helix-turn-helix domain-containing protein [Saccharomonospora cyanea]EHR61385.1 transcriptional regulator containing an amidase domain and an AraC-type DNA-binding HTH domain [Saccharomonospora cyanea NA-134]